MTYPAMDLSMPDPDRMPFIWGRTAGVRDCDPVDEHLAAIKRKVKSVETDTKKAPLLQAIKSLKAGI